MTGCVTLRKDIYYVRLSYYDKDHIRKDKFVSTGLSGRGAKQKATAMIDSLIEKYSYLEKSDHPAKMLTILKCGKNFRQARLLKRLMTDITWVRISCNTVLTIQRKFDIIFMAEDYGYTFLQMRSMYCFVEYKMLLFNPTLQETIGDDIIYIISKPPEDSASDHIVPKTESNRRLLLCLCTDTGMVYFGYPFFLSPERKKRNIY